MLIYANPYFLYLYVSMVCLAYFALNKRNEGHKWRMCCSVFSDCRVQVMNISLCMCGYMLTFMHTQNFVHRSMIWILTMFECLFELAVSFAYYLDFEI